MRTVYLTWREPTTRRWHAVGRLTSDAPHYTFAYTKGARIAQVAGFRPLASFPNLNETYVSGTIFPLFSNRLLRPTRPEYRDYLTWLDIKDLEPQPLEILGRSGGQRATDNYEIVPVPERTADGYYSTHFFLRGLRQMPPAAIERARSLLADERLLVMRDFQNPHDGRALALRTGDEGPIGPVLVGYCPRLLRDDIVKLLDNHKMEPIVTVARVNLPPAPSQFRVLCKLRMEWPEGFVAFAGEEYQPLTAADLAPQAA